MSILSSGLETADYSMPLWTHIYSSNIKKLNDTLLKIQNLQDVFSHGLRDDCALFWDASRGKWITRLVKVYPHD
jgi:hypothetical protein